MENNQYVSDLKRKIAEKLKHEIYEEIYNDIYNQRKQEIFDEIKADLLIEATDKAKKEIYEDTKKEFLKNNCQKIYDDMREEYFDDIYDSIYEELAEKHQEEILNEIKKKSYKEIRDSIYDEEIENAKKIAHDTYLEKLTSYKVLLDDLVASYEGQIDFEKIGDKIVTLFLDYDGEDDIGYPLEEFLIKSLRTDSIYMADVEKGVKETLEKELTLKLIKNSPEFMKILKKEFEKEIFESLGLNDAN
jgi:regulator of sigma D